MRRASRACASTIAAGATNRRSLLLAKAMSAPSVATTNTDRATARLLLTTTRGKRRRVRRPAAAGSASSTRTKKQSCLARQHRSSKHPSLPLENINQQARQQQRRRTRTGCFGVPIQQHLTTVLANYGQPPTAKPHPLDSCLPAKVQTLAFSTSTRLPAPSPRRPGEMATSACI